MMQSTRLSPVGGLQKKFTNHESRLSHLGNLTESPQRKMCIRATTPNIRDSAEHDIIHQNLLQNEILIKRNHQE